METTHPEAVKITVGGKERTLKIGPAAFRLAKMKGIQLTVEELSSGALDTLALVAYIGCLPDDRELDETEFYVAMADSDEGAILGFVAESLKRMTEGLNKAFSSGAEGNGARGQAKKK